MFVCGLELLVFCFYFRSVPTDSGGTLHKVNRLLVNTVLYSIIVHVHAVILPYCVYISVALSPSLLGSFHIISYLHSIITQAHLHVGVVHWHTIIIVHAYTIVKVHV